jgi:hypothetical protein
MRAGNPETGGGVTPVVGMGTTLALLGAAVLVVELVVDRSTSAPSTALRRFAAGDGDLGIVRGRERAYTA